MQNKILFDLTVCQPKSGKKYDGGGVYGYIVFSRLATIYPRRVVGYINMGRFINPRIQSLIDNEQIEFIDSRSCSLIDAIVSSNAAAFYSPLFCSDYNQLIGQKIPKIITFHGMRSLEMNRDVNERLYKNSLQGHFKSIIKSIDFFYDKLTSRYRQRYLSFMSSQQTYVITVSNHSKNSIRYYYPQLNANHIKVLYSPSTTIDELIPREEQSHNEKYYLIVSADRWIKNSYRAIQAFDTLFSTQPMLTGKVILTGINSKLPFLKKIKNKERFILKPYVSNSELESLFSGAYALIYPSLNEGFGYPPLEAMKYGVPVVTSAFSAISEVCSNAVLYTNPYSVDEIAMRILALEDASCYESMRQRSLERYRFIKEKQDKDLQTLSEYLISFCK